MGTSAMVSLLAALAKDGDGKVSASELRRCVAATLGDDDVLSNEEFLTADGDGLLDLPALLAGAGEDEEDQERERCLREAFAMYADEGSRRITPGSLGRMLGKVLQENEWLDEKECRAMICRFDLDGDGVLSFHEFAVMMMMA